jgi:hypothetical protein
MIDLLGSLWWHCRRSDATTRRWRDDGSLAHATARRHTTRRAATRRGATRRGATTTRRIATHHRTAARRLWCAANLGRLLLLGVAALDHDDKRGGDATDQQQTANRAENCGQNDNKLLAVVGARVTDDVLFATLLRCARGRGRCRGCRCWRGAVWRSCRCCASAIVWRRRSRRSLSRNKRRWLKRRRWGRERRRKRRLRRRLEWRWKWSGHYARSRWRASGQRRIDGPRTWWLIWQLARTAAARAANHRGAELRWR